MKRTDEKNNNSGTAILFALIFCVILTIGVAGYLLYMNGQANVLKHYSNYNRAFYLAESGIEKAIIELEKYNSPPVVFPGIEETNYGGGTYEVPSAPADYSGDMIRYELHSMGNVNGVTREVVAFVQTESFAKWSYFTNSENYLVHWWRWWISMPVWFTTGSYLEGPVHTNGQFNVSGYPMFNGPMSSVSDSINYMHGPSKDGIVFYNEAVEGYSEERDARFEPDELSLGADEIDISFLNADRLIEVAAEPEGMAFNGDTEVVLLCDATMNVTNAELEGDKGLKPHTQNLDLPANGALFVQDGDLKISGTLDGQLTVGASGDVIIVDDVLYETDPRNDPDSDDKLGIISSGNVIIDKNAPQDVDPPDPNGVSIHASIIALDESFTVENYWIGKKQVLTVLGGIIQKERGPVGTFNPSNNQKVSGYDKNYQYDSRMRTSPPPYFPMTGEYEMVYWSEEMDED